MRLLQRSGIFRDHAGPDADGLRGGGAGTWLTAFTQTTLAYAASHNLFDKAAKARVLAAGTTAISQLALLYSGLGRSASMRTKEETPATPSSGIPARRSKTFFLLACSQRKSVALHWW